MGCSLRYARGSKLAQLLIAKSSRYRHNWTPSVYHYPFIGRFKWRPAPFCMFLENLGSSIWASLGYYNNYCELHMLLMFLLCGHTMEFTSVVCWSSFRDQNGATYLLL